MYNPHAMSEHYRLISPETGEPEHHEARWMSFDEAYDITSPRVREVVRWARNVIGT